MLINNILYVLKILMYIFGVCGILSSFLFNSKGRATRKTIIVAYIFLVLTVVSMWLIFIITEPSLVLESFIAFSGIMIVSSTGFAFKYFSLPFIERTIDNSQKNKS